MYEYIVIQLLIYSIVTAYLILCCFYVSKKQREPTRLYRSLKDEDEDITVERIVIPETPADSSPQLPWWNFDNVRAFRAARTFVGPAVHGATRAPVHSSGGPPPPYSCAVNDAPLTDVPPPTYQQVISQQQETANTTPDT